MDSSQQTFVGVGAGGGSACQKGYFVCLSVCVCLCLCLCVYMCVRASSCAAFKNAKNENFDLWVTVAKPKYALLIYNALKSNTLSPHASSAMRRWQRQEGGGESWVTTLSPCLAVFVSSCVCVWAWTWSGIGWCCCCYSWPLSWWWSLWLVFLALSRPHPPTAKRA